MADKNHFLQSNSLLKHQALQKMIGHCPLCNYEYQTINAKILDDNEEAQLIYIRCPNCLSSIVVLVLSSGPFLSSIGMITDLNEEDVLKLKNSGHIQEEDILNLHKVLKSKNFCLEFKKIFNK